MEYRSVIQAVADNTRAQVNRHPLDTVNQYMRETLINCASMANSRAEFTRMVRKETGLTNQGISNSTAVQYLLNNMAD